MSRSFSSLSVHEVDLVTKEPSKAVITSGVNAHDSAETADDSVVNKSNGAEAVDFDQVNAPKNAKFVHDRVKVDHDLVVINSEGAKVVHLFEVNSRESAENADDLVVSGLEGRKLLTGSQLTVSMAQELLTCHKSAAPKMRKSAIRMAPTANGRRGRRSRLRRRMKLW